jgi:hypothetical protein
MKLGIVLPYSGADMSLHIDRALEAERLGFDSVWTSEGYGSRLAIPASSASFIPGVGHHESNPGLGADVCNSLQGRTYSKSRNCGRQLTRRANVHNPRSGLRVRACRNGGARHGVVSFVPREQSGDSHHQQDAGEVDRKLHQNVAAQPLGYPEWPFCCSLEMRASSTLFCCSKLEMRARAFASSLVSSSSVARLMMK